MGMFTSINIATTGMSVERLRSDVISNNIANVSTTRTPEGGAFKKSSVIVEPIASAHPTWRMPFVNAEQDNGPGKGVRVKEIVKDTSKGRMVYEPSNPDAIQSGYKIHNYIVYFIILFHKFKFRNCSFINWY